MYYFINRILVTTTTITLHDFTLLYSLINQPSLSSQSGRLWILSPYICRSVCLCVCVSVCLSVYTAFTTNISVTIGQILMKLGGNVEN